VLIRQAHPGEGAGPYTAFAQKAADAERFARDERIPYPVLVDDLEGTVHQAYGGLADPTYLIDADGRVAFYNMWTHAPTLWRALERLLARGGRGAVRDVVGRDGIDHVPHLLSTIAHGWKGLRRGAPTSVVDIELALPGSGLLPWVGWQLRPLLEPVAIRARPLPPAARLALGAAAVGLAALWLGRRRRATAT
jgi:hypothetical protein